MTDHSHWPHQVDGVRKRLPYSVPLGAGRTSIISAVGSDGSAMTTDFGLRVTFDGLSRLAVHVPAHYARQLCGLCGNYDGRSTQRPQPISSYICLIHLHIQEVDDITERKSGYVNAPPLPHHCPTNAPPLPHLCPTNAPHMRRHSTFTLVKI